MTKLGAWPEVWTDTRLGGKPRYVVAATGDALMQVPDVVRKSVAFLCCQRLDGLYPVGTGFFVSYQAAEDAWFTYLVTAKHVIDGIRLSGTDGKVYVRVNTANGTTAIVVYDLEQWVGAAEDEPEYIDVAVAQWPTSTQVTLDYRTIPTFMFADESVVAQLDLGDELFMTGLFVNHYGRERNIPIVRVGNLSGMPEEKVQTNEGAMDAYLAETRSLGGLSGSPTFVMFGSGRHDKASGMQVFHTPQFYLLGLMRGHWDAQLATAEDTVLRDASGSTELVNMGIAIVVPASKILHVMNRKELHEQRDVLTRARDRKSAPTADVALPEQREMTRGEFYAGLRKIKKQPPPE